MDKVIIEKLELLKDFQDKNPTSHVGGSIGLMLRGINLNRGLRASDLDITTDVYDEKDNDKLEPRSDGNDFDYAFVYHHGDGYYTKVDIRVNPEPSFDVVEFNGVYYNVSKERDILFWKKKYAEKGVKKHIIDLAVINGEDVPEFEDEINDDDLPF